MDKVQTTIRLPFDLKDRLQQEADRLETDESEIIIMALRKLLSDKENQCLSYVKLAGHSLKPNKNRGYGTKEVSQGNLQ